MTLNIRPLALPDVKLVTLKRFGDVRGFFVESWNRGAMKAAGLDVDFCQDNLSHSVSTGTLRGLHFQRPPFAQAKLVSVLKGRIFDVVVDLRKNSPSYHEHVSVELDSETGAQLFVPAGFAHGFCTLEPDTLVFYKVDAHFSAHADTGILWSDPDLGICWPVTTECAVLSPKDSTLPRLKDIVSAF